VKRIAVVFLVLAAGFAAAPGAHAQPPCGLPDVRPLWFDFADGSVEFRKAIFGNPGVIAATSGPLVSQDLRVGGAQTVYWEMKLGSYVGTTQTPADPGTVVAAANRLVAKAVASTGCNTPYIALNELNGPATTTPWTPNNGQYRANVLVLLREIAALGARPFLLIPGPAPYTGGEAAAWWQQTAQVADIVPEIYFNAPAIKALGPVAGSRQMRTTFRAAIRNFTEIGIPVERLGLVLGFQSVPPGGRMGLKSSTAWFEFVKLNTLAAKKVASELGITSIWTWGWGNFTKGPDDPDKPAAACVYLWARDQSLCDGPNLAGADFNAALDEGQISVPQGAVCVIGRLTIWGGELSALTQVTGDREIAFTALLERAVESTQAQVTAQQVDAAEKAIIDFSFDGNRDAFLAALQNAHAAEDIARAVIADQLRRARIASTLPAAAPTDAEIRGFYTANPQAPVREFEVYPAPAWLGGQSRGFALGSAAPGGVFDLPLGKTATLRTAAGSYAVKPLGEPFSIGALPFAFAQVPIRAALLAFARGDAFAAWTAQHQNTAFNNSVCISDGLPAVGSVDLSTYLPFLDLNL
jgi:hypothetical protein